MIKVKASKPACPLANTQSTAASACTYWPHRYHRPRCCKCCRCPHRPRPHWQYYPQPYYPSVTWYNYQYPNQWTHMTVGNGDDLTGDYTTNISTDYTDNTGYTTTWNT